MRLPPPSASSSVHSRYARYVARRLWRAEQYDLAEAVRAVDAEQVTRSRELEDLEGPVSEALADRDAADDDLDDTAQQARHTLAGRSVSAAREAPYTLVFPSGIQHYISATLADQSARYKELSSRLEAHLPENDEVRSSAPVIRKQLSAWEEAVDVVTDARNAEALARTRYEQALEDWRVTIERTYGGLVSLYGKKKAERFFPKSSRREQDELPPAL